MRQLALLKMLSQNMKPPNQAWSGLALLAALIWFCLVTGLTPLILIAQTVTVREAVGTARVVFVGNGAQVMNGLGVESLSDISRS